MIGFRALGLIISAVSPWFVRKLLFRYVFGYKIGKGAYVGASFIDATEVDLGDGAKIGSFTIVRNLDSLMLERNSRLGTFNWIFGFRGAGPNFFVESPERRSSLTIGEASAITSRHLIDCTDQVRVGRFSTIAGYRSQFLTHAIDFRNNRQACAPIKIGDYCFVGTGCIILKGAVLPNKTVLAAGTVVSRPIEEEGWIYIGNPAVKLRAVDQDGGYFVRSRGAVG